MAASDIALPQYPRDAVWLNERANMLRGYVPYSDQRLIEDSVVKCQALLTRLEVMALPRGMIHGDLFRDNVLFDQRSLTGVLDFHHAAAGYWLYDLAVIANDWCNDGTGALDAERTTSMLRAYHQIRPLTSQEVWFFGIFALYAALNFWLSRLAVAVDQRSAELLRFKNPDEFRRIVQQHDAHGFYLDERLLDI
jgi:homoserine kinase type II